MVHSALATHTPSPLQEPVTFAVSHGVPSGRSANPHVPCTQALILHSVSSPEQSLAIVHSSLARQDPLPSQTPLMLPMLHAVFTSMFAVSQYPSTHTLLLHCVSSPVQSVDSEHSVCRQFPVSRLFRQSFSFSHTIRS